MTNEEAIKVIMGVMNNYHIDSMINRKTDEALSVAIQALKAEPIKHGRWIKWDGYDGTYKCSVCRSDWHVLEGMPQDNGMYYCPNCGARMDEER